MKKRKYQHSKEYNLKQMINHAYKNMGGLQLKWIEANKIFYENPRPYQFIKVKWDRFYYLKLRIKNILYKLADWIYEL